jgi:hypothetical protein
MIKLKGYLIVLTALFTLLVCNTTGLGQGIGLTPETIFKNMGERYRTISSYHDAGVVETVTGGGCLRAAQTFSLKRTLPGRENCVLSGWTIRLSLPLKEMLCGVMG